MNPGIVAQEVMSQFRDILATLAQWRHRNWKNIQSIKQIRSKLSRLHFLGQWTIRRGDGPDINRGTISTHPLDRVFLKNSK